MSDKVYSYHTFLFPFIWKTDNNVSKEDFLKVLSIKSDSNNAEGRWVLDNWDDRKKADFLSERWRLDYAAYQYFTESANDLLFNSSDTGNAVSCFHYNRKYKRRPRELKLFIKIDDGTKFKDRIFSHICKSKNHFPGKFKEGNDKYLVKYIITKQDTGTKENKTYSLNINNIRLNVYDAGIAILILEMENCKHNSLKDVNAINEHGRRINFPFLVSHGGTHNLCADSIEIRFEDNTNTQNNENPFKEDFLYTSRQIKKYIEHENDPDVKSIRQDDVSFTYIMQPIQTLLDGKGKDNGGKEVTTNPNHKNQQSKFYIKPCVDDRMFVCCIVADFGLSNEIKGVGNHTICYYQDADLKLKKTDCTFSEKDEKYHVVSSTKKEYDLSQEEFSDKVDENNKYIVPDRDGGLHATYMEGWADETALSNRIYKFMYIENDLSCQETEMKKQILSGSVYGRWVNSGTLFGITHHSLCCITNPEVVIQVINPFLTQYVQMATLALAQRAVILMLEDEVAKVSNKFSESYIISEQDIAEIERLQAKYVKVQNQMLLSEVTVQEQGVEMYEMFRKQLYIEKNMKYLDSAMNNLRDVADNTNARLERLSDAKEDRKLNLLSYALTFLFIVEPLSIIITDNWNFFAKNGHFRSETWWFGIPFVLGVGSALVLLIKWIVSKCKK